MLRSLHPVNAAVLKESAMTRLLVASLLLSAFAPILSRAQTQTCTPIAPDANDGAIVSTKFHKVIYEDQDVRVLDVVNPPHTLEEMHTHVRPSVFIVLEDHPYVIHYLEGKPVQPPVGHTPYVLYLKPTPMHAIENPGDYTIHAIRVELKHPGCGPAPTLLTPQDALTADAVHTKLAFETEDVRILEITLPPHSREEMHTDAWPAIGYVDQPAHVRYFTTDHPPTAQRASATGVIRIRPEGLHAAESLSDTQLHLFRIELKRALPN
jgi:hypothetical protein